MDRWRTGSNASENLRGKAYHLEKHSAIAERGLPRRAVMDQAVTTGSFNGFVTVGTMPNNPFPLPFAGGAAVRDLENLERWRRQTPDPVRYRGYIGYRS